MKTYAFLSKEGTRNAEYRMLNTEGRNSDLCDSSVGAASLKKGTKSSIFRVLAEKPSIGKMRVRQNGKRFFYRR